MATHLHCYTSHGQADALLEALEDGPATRRLLAKRLGIGFQSLGPSVNFLLGNGGMRRIGTVLQALKQGFTREQIDAAEGGEFSKPSASVYALPAVPMLKDLPADVETCIKASEALPKSKGSGHRAGTITIGRGSVWGAGY